MLEVPYKFILNLLSNFNVTYPVVATAGPNSSGHFVEFEAPAISVRTVIAITLIKIIFNFFVAILSDFEIFTHLNLDIPSS